MVTSTPIPPLPKAPSRSDGPAAFNLYADPFIAAMPPMVVQINIRLEWIATQVNAAEGYKNAAALSAQTATEQAAIASGAGGAAAAQVALAAEQVTLAATQANNAAASATAAESAPGSIGNLALLHAIALSF